ncbi:alpha/beta fold hydrolase [Arenimonas sp. MALMAid1274]|uniref:alpha/beta fold hydrolase n=1 Tax=Arenimonas sp. MALMAid1274 TaxID=3411630 RepID=UPI003B9E4909
MPRLSRSTPPEDSTGPAASLVDDALGVAQLSIDGVLSVTELVEHLHAAISQGAALPAGPGAPRTRGLPGFVYGRVRDVVRGVGWGIQTALTPFRGRLRVDRVEREHLRAALNGISGDWLARAGNPLAIPMRLKFDGREPGNRIAVFVHGLCMHDRQWPRGEGSMHAAARDLGYTPVYLHYNSGQSVSVNGAEFSRQLDALLADWPRRVDKLAVVGHSMGGLVTRQACAHAETEGATWLQSLRTLVFLGTPHRGSSIERAGTQFDFALGMSPYSEPFARLGRRRSLGIRDLGRDHSDAELPPGVDTYVVAGKLAGHNDGLVSVRSALGLPVPEDRQVIVDGAGHLSLMRHPEAVATLERALASRRRWRA